MPDRRLQVAYYIDKPDWGCGPLWGVKPALEGDKELYDGFNTPISLRSDLGWSEKKTLQPLMRRGGIWDDFPFPAAALVKAEFHGPNEHQYLDLLCVDERGVLIPCELKLTGKAHDAAGQLLRYMADLSDSALTVADLRRYHREFMEMFDTPDPRLPTDEGQDTLKFTQWMHRDTFEEFIAQSGLHDEHPVAVGDDGFLMDEEFSLQLRRTVGFINGSTRFNIRLVELRAFTKDDWKGKEELRVRIDFVEVDGHA